MRKQDNFLKNSKRIIRCAKYNGKATVEPVIERVANIYENEDAPQKIRFVIKSDESDIFTVSTTLLMPFDCELPLKTTKVKSGDTVTVELPNLAEVYGVFYINASVRNNKGELLCEQLIPFSHVRTGTGHFKKSASLAHIINHDVPSSYELIDLYKKCGMRKMRVDFTWRFVEAQKGILEIPERWINIVDYLHKNDIEIHAVLNYGCEFYDDFKAPYTAEGLEAWLNYCRFTVNHFKGIVKHYEVWNEYNLCMGNAPGTPEKYAELLKPTYTAIKEIDPEIAVTAGVTCNTQPDWIRRMLSCDTYNYFDELSLHCYCQPDDVYPDNGQGETENNTKSYIDLMKPYGEPKPVWISEMGWTTAAGNFRSTRESQAACFARLFAIVETSDVIERLCYYNFRDSSPTNPFDPEFQWGSIEAPGAIITNAAKESFAAISCLNYMIGNAEFVSRKTVGKISHITYCENGEQIHILWSLDGNKKITLNLENTAKAYDMYGNELGITSVYELDENVIYIKNTTLEILSCEKPDKLIYDYPYTVSTAPEKRDDGWYVSAIVKNHKDRIDGRMRIELPELAKANRYERFSLNTGDTFKTSVKVESPDLKKLYRAIAVFDLEDGTHIEKSELVSFLAVNYGKPQNTTFSLSSKTDYVYIDGEPNPYLKADVALGYDEESLYIEADVKYKNHIQVGTTADHWQDIWDGDGLEFMLQPIYDGNNDIMRYNRMAFAKTSNTGEVVAWRWFCVSNRSVGRFRNCKCDITRRGENTHYSIAIPWGELLPPNIELNDCDSFGFAFRVNYAESTDSCVDGYAQLYSGIGHRRTALTDLPLELGRITLVKE